MEGILTTGVVGWITERASEGQGKGIGGDRRSTPPSLLKVVRWWWLFEVLDVCLRVCASGARLRTNKCVNTLSSSGFVG